MTEGFSFIGRDDIDVQVSITATTENAAPIAVNDNGIVDESLFVSLNLLANQPDLETSSKLTIVSVNEQAPWTTFTIISKAGHIGQAIFDESGTLNFSFETIGSFERLSAGETDTINLDYVVADRAGRSIIACAEITITGSDAGSIVMDRDAIS